MNKVYYGALGACHNDIVKERNLNKVFVILT
jgi:hypothetical protein